VGGKLGRAVFASDGPKGVKLAQAAFLTFVFFFLTFLYFHIQFEFKLKFKALCLIIHKSYLGS
jgi:hypothetical protein